MTSITDRPIIPQKFEVVADITAEDIAQGVKSNCERCPGARAFLRVLAPLGFEWIEVTRNYIWCGFGEREVEDGTPVYRSDYVEGLEDFTWRFDVGLPVEPTTLRAHFGTPFYC